MAEGWDGFFMLLEKALDGQVFGVELPLIGDELKDAARFIRDLREGGFSNLSIVDAAAGTVPYVQQRIFEAVGPGSGLNWLLDRPDDNDSIIDVNDVIVKVDGVVVTDVTNIASVDDSIQFDLYLSQDTQLLDESIAFDIGLDGLGLDLDGNVAVGMGFQTAFGFGVSKAHGVYFDTSIGGSQDFAFDVSATLP